MVKILTDEKKTEEYGRKVGQVLRAGDVVAFYGGLGAGKTTFIRGMASGMGLKERVYSPTFTIVNEYLGKLPMFHFDMYRLSGEDELFEIGWEDYIERGGVCAVEWSENVDSIFQNDTIKIIIEKINDNERRIEIKGLEERGF
jgi:tRNA threonylcarbamoyladenosine biosynthesis protein TsaE